MWICRPRVQVLLGEAYWPCVNFDQPAASRYLDDHPVLHHLNGVMVAPLPQIGPGLGHLAVRSVSGSSAVTTAAVGDPMKLLVTQARGPAVWGFTTTYGGGLLAGDRIRLSLDLGADTRTFLGSQASTKVYRSDGQKVAQVAVTATLGSQAFLAWLPDPVVPFAGSRLEQSLRVDLAPTASAVLLDAVTAGRLAREERWDLTRCISRLTVDRGGKPLLRDALNLRSHLLRERLGSCGVLATLFLTGPQVVPLAATIAAEVAAAGAGPWDGGLLIGAAPKGDDLLLRLAAPAWPVAEAWLHSRLAPLADLLDGAPWRRRP